MSERSHAPISRRRVVQGLAAAPIAGVLASQRGGRSLAQGDPVRFGVSGPFSGNNAEYGRLWRQAMDLAAAEINEAGGLDGRTLEIVYEDTQSDPRQSVPVAQKFVNDPTILAEIG